ncbi:MAG: HAD hydrolase-like protein [Phycisphaeraceae bacterium]|nr:HAD hydrolase-like protein [Phycisphaeraceae bacterium]
MAVKTLILWDIDGTLLLTKGAGIRAMQRVSRRLFGEKVDWEGFETAGWLDPLIFAHVAKRGGLSWGPKDHQVFHDAYIAELALELEAFRHDVEILPGVRHTIQSLHERSRQRGDVVQGLLTGNYSAAVPVKLRAADLDENWFEINALGDEADSRPALCALAMRKYEKRFGRLPAPRRVIVVGDTPRDVECAKAHDCVAFGVATGGYTVAALKAAGADVAVENLSDSGPLLKLVDQKVGEVD